MANNITWKYVKPIPDDSAIIRVLYTNGITLPEGLVECLWMNNGGRPSEYLFDTERSTGYVFNSLFSYRESDPYFIGSFLSSDLLDSGNYPIAIEASGDIVCFDVKSERFVLMRSESGAFELIDTNSNPGLFQALNP